MSEQNMYKPSWLAPVAQTETSLMTEKILKDLYLNTVCEEENCINKNECYASKTAAFMILGTICTRNCSFCNIAKGKPMKPQADEIEKIVEAVKSLNIRHAVITSVSRDDLNDGGAGFFAQAVQKIKEMDPSIVIELIIPDFIGDVEALKIVTDSSPQIISLNIETVPSLYQTIRSMFVYDRSLKILRRVKELNPAIRTKSNIVLGMGETKREVIEVFRDLLEIDCDYLTLGQYESHSLMQHQTFEYLTKEAFSDYGNIAREMGFKFVLSEPKAQGCYKADQFMK